MLVLCVDDDRLVRSVTGCMLRELGHEVIEAEDGAEALGTMARRGRMVDVLLTDIRMPGMSGYSLARKVQSDNPGLDIIYMTGFNDGPTPPGPMIHKPCTLARLGAIMHDAEQALHRRRKVARQADGG